MQRIGKIVAVALAVLIVTLGFGYVWGASGRGAIQSALDDTKQQLDLAEARGHLLDARVSLYNMNFGDASRRLEEAKTPLRRTRERYSEASKDESARALASALEHVDEAQRLANKLDPAANSKAGEALEAIRVATSK
jgi:hypothetical protein